MLHHEIETLYTKEKKFGDKTCVVNITAPNVCDDTYAVCILSLGYTEEFVIAVTFTTIGTVCVLMNKLDEQGMAMGNENDLFAMMKHYDNGMFEFVQECFAIAKRYASRVNGV